MALGMKARKKGLFGKPFEVPGTPGIGDGMDQMPTGVDPAPGLGMRGEAPEQKMGLGSRLFGQGWEDKAFALGGVIRGDTSGVQMMRQQKQAEQQAIAQQAAKMRERSLDMAEWDYKQRNEVPTIQRNAEYIRQTQGEDAASEYVRDYGQRPEEPRMVNIPGVGSYFGTMSEIQQMLGRGGSQGSGNIPRVTDEASYSALPPGSKFYDDEGNLRTKSGGPSQPATGGF